MEYALRDDEDYNTTERRSLNPCSNGICSTSMDIKALVRDISVLILVLMEYALRVWHKQNLLSVRRSLNPCSNGICSTRHNRISRSASLQKCLNPCSNGICSTRTGSGCVSISASGCLNPCSNGICSTSTRFCLFFMRKQLS